MVVFFDIHITAFISAIDSLLTVGRSSAPTRVLTHEISRHVVSAVVEDVKKFE